MDIEQVARNHGVAARELMRVGNAYTINYSMVTGNFSAQVNVNDFNTLAYGREIKVIKRDCETYPVKKQVEIGGVVFFCLIERED